MNHTTIPPAAAIRARVHQGALKRVTRFFASTLTDAFIETLQNARRSCATGVRVTVGTHAGQPAETPLTVTVTDDGAGIADPSVLLSFGENGWTDDIVAREDAAGMGVLSLAQRGCRIASRTRTPDGHAGHGWSVDLAPEHFTGRTDAEVRRDDTAPYPSGTAVQFHAAESADAIHAALANAARHYPLPVLFQGVPRTEPMTLERRAFLDGAVHAEGWNGLVFGVFRDRWRGSFEPDLNFFGLTVPVRLPTVETVHGGIWSVRADVRDCPGLELVLPARKEAVENTFVAGMREAARLAIYRAMATEPGLRPAFVDWTRARDGGIELAQPPRVLRPWRPAVADVDDWREPPKPAPVGGGALVMTCDPDPPEAQALWRAAARAGIAESLFEADSRLEGYGWYDGLDRVTGIDTEVTANGKDWPLDEFPVPGRTGVAAAPLPARPDAIRMRLAIETADGTRRTLDLPADLAFAGEAWSWVGEALPLATRDSALEPHRLAELLRHGFFSASDDAEADSRETQAVRFDEEALHIATRLLCSEDSALEISIAETVRRELFWLVPHGRKVEISITRPDVRVTLDDPAEAAT